MDPRAVFQGHSRCYNIVQVNCYIHGSMFSRKAKDGKMINALQNCISETRGFNFVSKVSYKPGHKIALLSTEKLTDYLLV